MAMGMTYARARLWLGISCVGTMVVVSVLLLLFRVPAHLLATGRMSFGTEVAQLVAVLFGYAFLSGPFDFFGGYILPKEYERSTLRFPRFLGRWLRGVILHSTILLLIALALLNAAKVGGFPMPRADFGRTACIEQSQPPLHGGNRMEIGLNAGNTGNLIVLVRVELRDNSFQRLLFRTVP